MGDASSAVRIDGDAGGSGVSHGNLAILDAVDLPIVVISRECRVVHANLAATTVLGLTSSDIGRSPGHIIAAEENLDRLCAQVCADGAPCRREVRIGGRYFLLRLAPYVGNDQEIVGTILTFTNVTAFRASIDQAIYEREYTKAILNTVIDPLIVLDADLRIQTANRAFYATFGISRDEAQGRSINNLGNDEWKTSPAWASIERLLSGQTEFQTLEINCVLPGSGYRTIAIEARPLAREGAPMILLAFRDITTRKCAEAEREALIERERMAHQEAEALNEVARALGSELDVQKLVQTVTDIATKLTGAEFGAFFYNVLDEQGQSYMLYTLSGASRESFEKFGMMPRNTPVFNTTFSGIGARRSDDIRKDPDYGTMPPHYGMPQGHLPVSSYLAVPVKSRSGEVIGGLFFGHPEPGIFTESSERLATGIASHAAIAVDNARLYRAAEQQARTSQRLASIVDTSDDAIISMDLDGVIKSWNKSAERLFGYTVEEALGNTVELLIPPDRPDEGPDILARLRHGERVENFETVRRRKDGTRLNISLTVSPVLGSDGQIVGASKIARDISDGKRAAEAIQALNAQLGVDLDAMTRIQQLSIRMMEVGDFPVLMDEIVETALQVTGADMGNIQLLEGSVLKIIAHRGFKSDFLNFFKQVDGLDTACGTAMKGGERVIVEDVASSPIFAGTAALSAMLQAEARAVQSTPLVTRSGEMIGMLSTHYRHPHRPSNRDLRLLDILGRQTADIIERRRAEQALRISEERLRLAQKAAQIGTFEWDIQTGVTTWSAEMEELYGLQPGAFGETQAEWETLVHPEDREAALKRVDEAFNTEMPVEGEWRVIWPDGSTHWLAGRFQVYREPGGTPTRMSGVNFEITERKNNENELRRANQDLEHFAYSASHDLQEPLRSIKIFSELLSGRYSGKLDNEAQAFLANVRNGARRMEVLVRDLLTYTQVVTIDGNPDYVDASAAVQSAIANLAGAIAESGATVTADSLPLVRVHQIQLQQLFQNLIGNAIKYHRPGTPPVVHVTALRQHGNWLFSVIDNGIGIESEFKERIFGLFKRLHTGDEYAGTGIGLALCQRIVERHHGRIWVESEPGGGSIFHFSLPI